MGNTASTTLSFYNAGSSAGNILGPLSISSKDDKPGLKAVLGIFVALAAVVFGNVFRRKGNVVGTGRWEGLWIPSLARSRDGDLGRSTWTDKSVPPYIY
jgi:hypothetical protein